MFDKILFVDFDGTITSEETLDGAMRMCLPPDMIKEGIGKMQSGEWKLKEAVTFAFDNIPSSRLPDIMEYVRTVPLRAGFGELLDAMGSAGIPVVVISGGLKPYVEELLKPYREKLLDIYSLDIDTTGPNIKFITPFEGSTDLVDKPTIMKKYDFEKAICVGDGLTDIQMAQTSDLVFARGTLAKVLEKKKIPFSKWDDFFDVRAGILNSSQLLYRQ